MTSKKIILAIPILAVLAFVIYSCGGDNQDENTIQGNDTIPASNNTHCVTHDFFYSLPSPIVMAKIFKKTGLKYVDGITNSPDNVSKYASVQSKTLNLGVYSSDLAYCVLNKQTQQASKYIESVKQLSDELGMSSLFSSDDYLNRFKSNLSNEDSLIAILSLLKSEMDMFMQCNEKEKQTLFVFIGAWVENLYIATQLTKEANKEKIIMRVVEQKYILNSLMNISTSMQNESEFKNLYGKLGELNALFENLSVESEGEKITMDELQLKAITEKTRELRKQIVN